MRTAPLFRVFFCLFVFVLSSATRAQTTPLSDLDALRYIASHGDLIQVLGADAAKGRSHYEQYGVKEGRTITFDPNRYMASHPDLIMAFAGSEEKATRHYIEWGYREGRSATAFDGLAYVASHADLISVFGTDAARATRHYIDWGYKEGRRVTFDPLAYIASYADLIAAFATDIIAGAKHYIQEGYKEGRRILFDALGYLTKYDDLRAAFGSNLAAATRHFINFGNLEGRSALKLSPVTLNFSASRSEVNLFQTAQLKWSSENAHECTAHGDWSGEKSTKGKIELSNDSAYTKTFSLTCANPLGSVTRSVSVKVSEPKLSYAGAWFTVGESELTGKYTAGTLANTFNGLVRLGESAHYGLISIGWGFSGFGNLAGGQVQKINAFLLAPDSNGNLIAASDRFVPNGLTNGGGSVVVADFNGDRFSDVVLLAHNESPFLALESTVFWGGSDGRLRKEVLTDKVMAHDAQLYVLNGVPRIITGTFTQVKNASGNWERQPDALFNPIYEYRSGRFVVTEPANIRDAAGGCRGIGGMTNAVIRGSTGYPSKMVSGDAAFNCRDGAADVRLGIWDFDQVDTVGHLPRSSLMPYLGTLPQYSSIESLHGKGIPHATRIYGRDLNHDGHEDIIVAQSLWSESNKDFPSAIQVLLNDGVGNFNDATSKLNPDYPLRTEEPGYSPAFVDLDASGIETILWDGSYSYSGYDRLADHVILNDGTGRLYPILNETFKSLGRLAKQFLSQRGGGPDLTPAAPRIISVPQPDGSLNFLAQIIGSRVDPKTGFRQTTYDFVNLPIRYDPRVDFTRDVLVDDRRGSSNIRVWAGDDIIHDVNAGPTSTIDGGLGQNRAIYSGPSSAYKISRNSDGSTVVITTGSATYPRLRDTLKNFQTVQFSDSTVVLQ